MTTDYHFGPAGEHNHNWGPTDHSHLSGTPFKPCVVDGCRFVTVYWESDDDDCN